MSIRRSRLPLIILAAVVLSAGLAWGMRFELGKTKDQLG